MESKRLDFLDIAKGLGIIFVLYSHSCGFPVFGNAVVAFYMPLFFFISGYVYKPGRPFGANVKRKLKQLLIPYAGYTLILYAEHILLGLIQNELTKESVVMPLIGALYSRAALFADMSGENVEFFLISNGPLWFITAMAAASIVFYLLVEHFLKNKKNMIIITSVLVAITAVFTYCPVLLPWSLDTVSACALFMLAGAGLGKCNFYSEKNKKKYNIILVVSVMLLYCVIAEIANPINMSLRDFGYPGVIGAIWFMAAAFMGTLVFLWICRHIERFGFTKVFIIIGKHTYSIMALHILMFKYLTKVYYLFGMTFEFNRTSIWYWIYWAVVYVIVIVACIVWDYVLSGTKKALAGVIRRK